MEGDTDQRYSWSLAPRARATNLRNRGDGEAAGSQMGEMCQRCPLVSGPEQGPPAMARVALRNSTWRLTVTTRVHSARCLGVDPRAFLAAAQRGPAVH
jgi:hypothetical protein